MSGASNPGAYLESVERIAAEAGRRILAIYDSAFDVTAKADGSPLTAADRAAHDVIVHQLQRLTPDVPVLSEESAEVDYAERGRWQRFWLVDPLDGTKEFVSRNGQFTVNIALIDRGEPILGVVHVPVTGVIYAAARGAGAHKRVADHTKTAIHARPCGGARPRVVASRSHATQEQREYLARLGEHELVSMGSSLKFCLVAEGAADVYPRLGPTMEWDTGAAQCVVEVAGGRVVTPENQPLRYNKPSLKNPWLITSGAGDVDWTRFLPALDGFK